MLNKLLKFAFIFGFAFSAFAAPPLPPTDGDVLPLSTAVPNSATVQQSDATATNSNFTILDLIKKGTALKGKQVFGNFKVIQKINVKSYLVSPNTGYPELDGRVFYLHGDKARDNNFDYYDGQSVQLWVVVEGTYSYVAVTGATSTVIKLKDNSIDTMTDAESAPPNSMRIYRAMDLVMRGTELKGQEVKDYFRVVQKINPNSYLVTVDCPPDDPDACPNYYLTKAAHKHFDFDFVDDESIYVEAIVGGTNSYETVTGGTATVLTLKALEARSGNYGDDHPTTVIGFYETNKACIASGSQVFGSPVSETIKYTNESTGVTRTYRLGMTSCGKSGYIADDTLVSFYESSPCVSSGEEGFYPPLAETIQRTDRYGIVRVYHLGTTSCKQYGYIRIDSATNK